MAFGHDFLLRLRGRKIMRIDHHFLRKAKTFLIELTAFVSLVLVLIKILVTEAENCFGDKGVDR
ncbi:MAG: hypothetical protein WBX38_16590 [Candidatus Sulfotelmatobacter sp.]